MADVSTLGIIAGGDNLPFITAREARAKGVGRLVAIAFPGHTAAGLEAEVDEIHWVRVGQLGKMIRVLKGAGVREAVMVGRLDPKMVISPLSLDLRMLALAARVPDRRADTVLKAIAGEMAKDGIALLDSTIYLSSCVATKGAMTRLPPRGDLLGDIDFGAGIARELARLDVGQTVVVRKKAVVAAEAMEGTDETLRRAAALCPRGMVVVKMSRPNQDMRFDVPVVGEATMDILIGAGAAALAVEAGRTLIVDRGRVAERADAAGMTIVGI